MKLLFVTLGFMFTGIGVVGIYLPVLPTTPFLLLAGACFARGSEKFHRWFINSAIYKKNIQPLIDKKPMDLRAKAKILISITFLISISFCFMKNLHGRVALVVVLLIHYYYFIFRVKSK